MATPTNLNVVGESESETCEIEATVVTGFESVARTEAIQKVPYSKVKCERGRIFITTRLDGVSKVLELSSIDNCYVVMTRFSDVDFTQDQLKAMGKIRQMVKDVNWEIGLKAWQQVYSFPYPVIYRPDSIPDDLGEPVIVSRPSDNKKRKLNQNKQNQDDQSETEKHVSASTQEDNLTVKSELFVKSISNNENLENKTCETDQRTDEQSERVRLTSHDPSKLTFRVTCNRTGNGHCFQSMCAAANFGGAIHQYFSWNIDMKKFDVEVILNIDNSNVYIGLALTKESLHRRNIAHFGPTTLRPTIAFNMLRMCNIRAGDVVCDPMCGGGTIPIEASVNWPQSAHICGEIHELGVKRCRENIDDLNLKRRIKGKPTVPVDALRWDTSYLPLRDSSVDVFISDLPFGKRIGHKVDNWKLYPASMMEMARVCRPDTGRACFLTHDKRCMIKTIHALKKFWRQVRNVTVNIGGLSAVVFLIYRTGNLVTSLDKVPTADVLRKLSANLPPEKQNE